MTAINRLNNGGSIRINSAPATTRQTPRNDFGAMVGRGVATGAGAVAGAVGVAGVGVVAVAQYVELGLGEGE